MWEVENCPRIVPTVICNATRCRLCPYSGPYKSWLSHKKYAEAGVMTFVAHCTLIGRRRDGTCCAHTGGQTVDRPSRAELYRVRFVGTLCACLHQLRSLTKNVKLPLLAWSAVGYRVRVPFPGLKANISTNLKSGWRTRAVSGCVLSTTERGRALGYGLSLDGGATETKSKFIRITMIRYTLTSGRRRTLYECGCPQIIFSSHWLKV